MTPELTPGMRCGDYELLAFIGKGGMAQVWSARNVVNGELAAVKTLLPLYAADPVLQERLSREGDSQKALIHPNILRAQGTFRLNGSIFMVMDLVDGESLERYMIRRRTIPVPEVRGIAQAVLGALQHAHEAQIVHRDVKPSNILLSRTGKILLSDFGIALLRNAVRLTRIGGIGTPCYMSPEQIVGRDIGPLSDIYSVGCVLYELLTGLPPFHAEGPNANEVVREAHQFQTPAPLLPIRPDIPSVLEIAILRALEKKPAARFQSCAEFAAALGVSIQRQASGNPQSNTAPLSVLPAQGGSDIQTPRMGTPAEARGGQRISTPRVYTPVSGPGVTTMRPSRPSATGTPVVSTITNHPRLSGTIAIGGAVLLAVTAIARWEATRPPAPSQQAVGAASSSGAMSAGYSAQPSAPGAAGSAVDAANTSASPLPVGHSGEQGQPDLSPVAGAINQLKDIYDRTQSDSTPAAAPANNRPPPLAPPPGASAHTSGVLQWTGTKGDDVEINGSSASKGFLTGDQLPGVPVRVWVENDDGTVTQSPSDADGYRHFTLRMTSGHARIRWQTIGAGQTK